MRFFHLLLSTIAASLLPQFTPVAVAQVRSNCNVRVVGQVRGSQVNMRSGPGTNFSAPNYVLVGQSVNMLNNNNGERVLAYDRAGNEWYLVEYIPTRTRGWIRGDLLAPLCN